MATAFGKPKIRREELPPGKVLCEYCTAKCCHYFALPIETPESDDSGTGPQVDYIYEPDPREVLEQLLPRYVEMQIYNAVLESAASEQSARVVAMRNATDSANDIRRELTLTYNKARQEQITKELLDIVGGASALEEED